MSFDVGATGDVLDVLLRLSGLQAFVAGTREAALGVKSVGDAAADTSAKSEVMGSKGSGAAGLMQRSMVTAGTAVAAFAVVSTKMAINFQQQMELIHTQAGATQGEVTTMSKAILAMSASGMYAQGPTKLAEGLYHLESVGLRGKAALDALKVAANGAAVGNADLEQTTTALAAAWLVNIRGAGSLNNVMATINATVGAGNMRMGDLINSLGTGVLAAGKLAGLSLQDVMGALATLSDEGYRGSSAMAQLATSFHFLTDPTKKATDALGKIGLSKYALPQIMRTQGLMQALKVLRDHLATLAPVQREAALGDILPAGRGRVLEVLMNQVDRYGMKMHQIAKTTSNFNQDIVATHQTAAFRIHAAWAQIQAAMVQVGQIFIPIATEFAHLFSQIMVALIPLIPLFKDLLIVLIPVAAGFVAVRLAVLASAAASAVWEVAAGVFDVAMALVTGGTLEATTAWIALSAAMDLNPFVLLVGAIVAVVVAIYLAYKNVGWFRTAVNDTFKFFKLIVGVVIGAVVLAFKFLWKVAGDVINWIGGHWKWLMLLMGPIGVVIDIIVTHWKWLMKIAGDVINFIGGKLNWLNKSVIQPVANALVSAWQWATKHITQLANTIGNALGQAFSWTWNNIIKPVINWIVGAFNWMVKQITNAWNKSPLAKLINFAGSAGSTAGGIVSSIGHFIGLQSGGTVIQAGAAVVGEHGPELLNLPRAAQVIPLTGGGFNAGGLVGTGGFTIIVPVEIDGREVARATGQYVSNRLARQ